MTAGLSDAERGMLIDELSRSRRGYGLHEPFTGEARETNPRCGDDLTVRVSAGEGTVTALSWHGRGCTVSMAAAAALATIAPGRSVSDLRALAERYFASVDRDGSASDDFGPAEAFAGVGRYPLRATCATLAWRAALAAVPSSPGP